MIVVKHGMTLALAAAVALAVALGADALWRQKIEDNRREYEQKLLLETLLGVSYTHVVSVYDDAVSISQDLSRAEVVGLWRVVKKDNQNEEIVAMAARVVVQGYGGDIVFVVSFDTEGRRLQSRIVRHVETPGIADFLLDEDGGERAINGVSGATITSNALREAANEVGEWVRQYGEDVGDTLEDVEKE